MGGGGILSYVYYAPWGLTSQGALYALMFKRHQLVYGTTEEQLPRSPSRCASTPRSTRTRSCANAR